MLIIKDITEHAADGFLDIDVVVTKCSQPETRRDAKLARPIYLARL